MDNEYRVTLGIVHKYFPDLDKPKTQELCSRISFAKTLYKIARGDPAPPMDGSPFLQGGKTLADVARALQRLCLFGILPEDTQTILMEEVEKERSRANAARVLKTLCGRPPHYTFVAVLDLAYFEASGKAAKVGRDWNRLRLVHTEFTNFVQDLFDALCERRTEHVSPSLASIQRALDRNPTWAESPKSN